MARFGFLFVLCAVGYWPCVSYGQLLTDAAVAESVATGTARQQHWLSLTGYERIRQAEAIGEDGARVMAKAKGYIVLYDGLGPTLPQGPDQVYRALDGRVIVYEAKGGTGQLGHAYGHAQGTAEWAVESAKRVLRSSKAGVAERTAAQEVLKAAAQGKLEVHLIRTTHVLGEPVAAVLESVATTTDDAARMARTALAEVAHGASQAIDDVALAADDIARSADDVARTASESGTVLKTVAKVAVPVAVAIDSGFRIVDGIETERQFAAGEISVQQREVEHAKNTAGMAVGWAGAWGGAQLGAVGGGTIGTAIAPGPGTVILGVIGGVGGGVSGYFGGEAAGEVAAEWTMTKFHAAGATITDTANSAAGGIQSTWNWAWGN